MFISYHKYVFCFIILPPSRKTCRSGYFAIYSSAFSRPNPKSLSSSFLSDRHSALFLLPLRQAGAAGAAPLRAAPRRLCLLSLPLGSFPPQRRRPLPCARHRRSLPLACLVKMRFSLSGTPVCSGHAQSAAGTTKTAQRSCFCQSPARSCCCRSSGEERISCSSGYLATQQRRRDGCGKGAASSSVRSRTPPPRGRAPPSALGLHSEGGTPLHPGGARACQSARRSD